MRKKTIIIILCLIAAIALAAEFLLPAFGILHWSADVSVIKAEPLAERNYLSAHWMNQSEEQAYSAHPVIVTGSVTNVREAEVSFQFNGKELTSYITLFDFIVTEYLSNTSKTVSSHKRILTIGYSASSRSFPEGVPVVENGKRFLLFCQVPAELDQEDPQKKAQYVDCWVYNPDQLMLEEAGGKYIMNSFWGSYLGEDHRITAQQDANGEISAALRQRTSKDHAFLASTGYAAECQKIEQLIKEKAESYR